MFNYTKDGETNIFKLVSHIVLGTILGLITLIILFGSWNKIEETERGVVLRLGKVTEIMEPGLQWKNPFLEDVIIMDVSVQKEIVNGISASSADIQEIFTNVAVQYHLDASKVGVIYSEYKKRIKTRVIDSAIQDAVKNAISGYTAAQLITERLVVKDLAESLLRERLAEVGVIVKNLDITNFEFSEKYKNGIEAKVLAEQRAEEQIHVTAQEEEKKKQEILRAEAIAEKTRLEVAALAAGSDLIEKIRAEASLEAAKRWNGDVPASVTIIGGDGGGNLPIFPFLNVK